MLLVASLFALLSILVFLGKSARGWLLGTGLVCHTLESSVGTHSTDVVDRDNRDFSRSRASDCYGASRVHTCIHICISRDDRGLYRKLLR